MSRPRYLPRWTFALLAALGSGCAAFPLVPRTPAIPSGAQIVPPDVPVELNKVTHPEHVIEAPDILQITATQAIPRQPYKIQTFDTLSLTVQNVLKEEPLTGLYVVDPEGMLNLGPTYKKVKVSELTVDEAQKAIEKHLMGFGLAKAAAAVAVTQTRGLQQIAGEHLVRADGTVYLGLYGSVSVTGLTLTQAKQKIEQHLTTYLYQPEITLDVLAYNSKVIYVIFDGGGVGQQVTRLPVTGNETVLDAISQLNGLAPVSDQNHIWVARPTPRGSACDQILPVDWVGLTTRGQTATNYQLMPGDRVYVKAYRATTFDTALARFLSPIERMFGIVLLASSTIQQVGNSNRNNGGFFGP